MNIGLVCPYEWTVPGGVGNHVRALAGELRRAGHRVDVLAPAERPVAEAGFVGLGGSLAVPYNGSVARIAIGPRTLVRVRRAVREGGYDLLHVHEPLSPSVGLLAATQAGRGDRGVPVVGTFHANLGRSLALEAASPLLRRVYDRLAGRIAVSASARDTWQGHFGGAMAVVPNGVAPEFFARPDPLDGWKGDGPTVLFVGRLEPRKGLAYLVRAFLRLKPAFPRLRLLVVGRDDRHQRDKAMAMVPPRLRPDLVFVGSVPQADLPSYYASADLFCAPSLGGESFGIVLAEAMAVGLPVVCSDIGGYRDVVRDGADGLLVPPRDPEALAAAIAGLLDNPARLAAMGEAAATTARRYAWPVVAGEVAEVYEAALAGMDPQADSLSVHCAGGAASRGGGVDVAAALWGGIIGAIVAATVYAGFLGLRLTRLDLLRFEGGLLVRDRSSMVYIYGVTVQVVAGALLALVYLQVFKGIESATFVGWGALLGLAQGVLAVLLLPVLGMLNRNVRAGDEPRPGQFGRAYGSLTPVALLVASVVFGTWVGIVLIP